MSIVYCERFIKMESIVISFLYDRLTQSTMYSSTITQYEKPKKNEFNHHDVPSQLPCHEEGEQPLIWRNILGIAILHVLAIVNVVLYYDCAKFNTWIFSKY